MKIFTDEFIEYVQKKLPSDGLCTLSIRFRKNGNDLEPIALQLELGETVIPFKPQPGELSDIQKWYTEQDKG